MDSTQPEAGFLPGELESLTPEQVVDDPRLRAAYFKAIKRTLNIDGLASNVDVLVTEVHGLREEVGRRVSKTSYWLMVLVLFLAVIGSNVVTFGVVSKCFLGSSTTVHPGWCSAIPSYSSTQTQNKVLLQKFQQTLDQIPINSRMNSQQDAEILRLEKQIAVQQREIALLLKHHR